MEMTQKREFLLVKEYLEKYPGVFTKEEEREILSCVNYLNKEIMFPAYAREVFDELDLLIPNENIYLGFIELADEVFNLANRNILEIGGGILPRLGERISSLQDKGSITVYDKRLSKYKQDTTKMKLVREEFNKSKEINDIDLVLGLMPCKAAELIIDVARQNNIDFMIALCEGGPHGDEFDFFEDEDEWIHSVIFSAKCAVRDKEMGKLKVKNMERCGNPYPVIYNARNS